MADSKQIRAEIVTRLLNDAAFFDRFLQDPDAVLAEFPGLDQFDGRFLKDEIEDRAGLEDVAEQLGIAAPERPSAPPPAAQPERAPRLQMALHLRDDPAFWDFFQKDPDAALAAYPNLDDPAAELEDANANLLRGLLTGESDLAELINDFEQAVRSVRENAPSEPKRPSRYVNTGFASQQTPNERITSFNTPLAAAQPYYFWLKIGEIEAAGLAQEAIELPSDKLPPEARLKVALFAFDGEIALTGAETGEIQLTPQGDILVTRRADEPDGVSDLDQRLYFAVRPMPGEGYGRLRCNIYYQNTLVQSHLIVARVAANPAPQDYRMLWHTSDYTLSKNLNSEQLVAMGENRLSIMINDNGNGSHGFRFLGGKEFKNDATLTAGVIGQLQTWTRGALRTAAWGDNEEYTKDKRYRYDTSDSKKLKDDLVSMAIDGFSAYDTLIDSLAGGDANALRELMKKPGQLQIATKEAAQLVLPAAMFYDYPFLDGNAPGDYSLCPTFLAALDGDKPLEECQCFQGNCPSYDDKLVVCPSGFWGFRHFLGLPLSIKGSADAPLRIGGSTPPKMAVSVWTGSDFKERPSHEQRLQKMGVGWEYADSREASLNMLAATESQLVYFYCHGGLTDRGKPYLLVGNKGGNWFVRSNLRDLVRWEKIRPLVFINGCHTTQLTPERALDFVSGFVQTSGAAGVIGTEITIFEPIAVQFAEECLHRFLFQKQTLGEAVRGARLHMLKNGNPLGLVYIPYALPALKLA